MKKRYLYRKDSVSDRREKTLFLTGAAWRIEKEVVETMQEWTEIMTKEFTKEEKERLLRLMGKVAENA
ncbi:hypothetical protein MHA01_18690 [Marinococcus halophilus]|uniref:HTH marR-type domain-containing protein n=1 Tax=Marinococcus halophilus TaxID=1371 RepID=A0A510Y6J2_MARHA|nr:hypothetical protein [Marinococcus halophilus]GEK58964.1 hypothetical protein MHA01_18690 [Marinococcus halophilus]